MAHTPLFRVFKKALNTAGTDGKSLTRRHALKLGTLAASGMAFEALARSTKSQKKSTDTVTILGAGAAGLSAAYALQRAGIKCAVYEASARVGGRIYTQKFNDEGMFCELGGELVDSGHTALMSLAKHLGLEIEEFAAESHGLEPDLYYFNGHVYTDADVIKVFAPVAHELRKDADKLKVNGEVTLPTALMASNSAYFNWAKQVDNTDLASYLKSLQQRVGKNVPDWLFSLLSIAYKGEFGLECEEQSALNFLLMIGTSDSRWQLFGESDESLRIKGGNGQLISKLYEEVSKHSDIHLGAELVAIKKTSHGLTLKFTGGLSKEVAAQRVICTIPFSRLRLVRGIDDLDLSAGKLKCIRELGYGTNTKHMLGFKSRFWRKASVGLPASTGAILTDLPNNQFWDTSRLQNPGHTKDPKGIVTNFLSGRVGESTQNEKLARVEFLKSLSAIYRDISEKDVDVHTNGSVCAALMNWSRYRFNLGAYTAPRVGQYTTLLGHPGTPELSGALLFAGEHVSLESQGYMNGAVETGLAAARELAKR